MSKDISGRTFENLHFFLEKKSSKDLPEKF